MFIFLSVVMSYVLRVIIASFLLCYPTTATIGAVVVAASTAFPCVRFKKPSVRKKCFPINKQMIVL